jgi:hypothetical protein
MAIAHICLDCGWDLARLRPRKEPHYNLFIVHCPRCESVSVRRVHPMMRMWKSIRRVDWALTMLVAQLILTAAFTVANLIGASSVAVGLWTIYRDNAGDDVLWFIMVPLLIIAPLTGAWLTAGFSHISAWKVWLGWYAWLLIMLVLNVTITLAGSDELAREVSIVWNIDPLEKAMYGALFAWLAGGPLLLVMLVFALPGIVLGRGVLWSFRRLGRSHWRVRRRMRRRALVTA